MKPMHALVLSAAMLAAPAAFAGDPVADSFQRMFDHTPAPAAPVSADVYRGDPVARAIAAALERRQPEASNAASPSPDPVFASFQRMLNHAPNRALPPLPADAGTDPLYAAVVLPLWRSRLAQYARSASGRRS